MKKKLILALVLFLASCGGSYQTKVPTADGVVRTAYLTSVSVLDGKDNVVGAGVIILNKQCEPLKVLTAAHVVNAIMERNGTIKVAFGYEAESKVMVVEKISNEDIDLAIIKSVQVQEKDGPQADIAKNMPPIGSFIMVIGSPMGEEHVVTTGIVSNIVKDDKDIMSYRISAPTFFGNSGGPVFNEDAEVVGILQKGQMIMIGISFVTVPGGSYAICLKHIKDFL